MDNLTVFFMERLIYRKTYSIFLIGSWLQFVAAYSARMEETI